MTNQSSHPNSPDAAHAETHDVLANFEAIVARTHPQLRAYIAGMGVASHEVDDVAQEVYLALFRGQEKVPPETTPDRWLRGIARNLCLNHIRRSSRRGRLHREALAELLANEESFCERSREQGEFDGALENCLRHLPEDSKRLLLLRYRDDLTSQRIAEVVDSTSQAIRVALFRIRASLRNCITQTVVE
ncbi:MAG: sigma-70 family RNA polymerase sigma factor [Planctomycetales bacterium]|nr:sigma-70 family RNA polymerase sigma factor [Planctomycetales bacterium]